MINIIQLGCLFPIIAFVPGIFIIILLHKWLKLENSILYKILLGLMLWNYVLVAPAMLLGFFTNMLSVYFSIFTILSISILFITLILLVLVSRKKGLLLRINVNNIIILIILLFLLTVICYFTVLQPFFSNWDPIALYLPFSKSIIVSGGLQTEIYHNSEILTTQSPMVPLVYAWVLSQVGQIGLLTIPCIYIVMTTITTYLVAKELLPNKTAILSPLAFLTMPAVLSMMAYHGLYLDVAFTCYLMTTILMVIKSCKEKTYFNYCLLSISAFLFLITRLELAIFILPSFLSLVFYYNHNIKFKRLLITSLCGMSLWSLLIFDLFFSGLSAESKFFLMSVLPLLVAYSFIVYVFLGRIRITQNTINRRSSVYSKLGHFFVLFLPCIPAMVFICRNILELKSVTFLFLWNAQYAQASAFFSSIGAQTTSVSSFIDVYRWDNLLLSEGMIAPFLIPFMVGAIFMVYDLIKGKLNNHFSCFIIISLTYLVSWSWIYRCDFMVRRLFVLAPLASIVIVYGFYKVAKALGFSKRIIASFSVFCAIIFFLTWRLNINAISSNDVVLSYNLLNAANPLWLVIYSAVFLIITFIFRYRIKFNKLPLRSSLIRLTSFKPILSKLIILCLSIALLLGAIAAPLSNELETAGNNTAKPSRLADVIDFYDTDINDSSVTVVFYAHELIWYANRSVIDLSTPVYSMPLLSALKEQNVTALRNSLIENNIRYFLVPKPSDSYYSLYDKFVNNTLLFNLIEHNSGFFELISRFKFFSLYKLLSDEELSSSYLWLSTIEKDYTAKPLNNFTNISQSVYGLLANPKGRIDSQVVSSIDTAFWKTSGELVKLENADVEGKGCVSISVLPHEQTNIFIYHVYNQSQDWSSAGYLSIWVYGRDTNLSIPVIFHSNAWQDYFVYSIKDNFIGWHELLVPKSAIIASKGSPSWEKIDRVDIMLGNFYGTNTATIYLGGINTAGYSISLSYTLDSIPNITESTQLILATTIAKTSNATVELKSINGTLIYWGRIIDGTNVIKVDQKNLLNNHNELIISLNALSDQESICINYIAIKR